MKRKKDSAINMALHKFKKTLTAPGGRRLSLPGRGRTRRERVRVDDIHIVGAKRGVTLTPDIEHAVRTFIRCADRKETVGAQAYRDCYRAMEHLAALLGKKAMFRVGQGPAFKLRKPTVVITRPKELEYVRTDARTQSLKWSELEAEKAGFRFPENELPGLPRSG